ncbi:hypothetical protein [Vibrio quintilis]|uniref:Uncharacterized protein n=1 Tax=Vibrio quintilis TaxID=1117707 RepID=A0A1M7Z359_9VIBR|nr:hypothetical protein [Vibrio quintilis]SHO59331.1 hypothetical protein VQ7734_05115 [Vibrio quintilis]
MVSRISKINIAAATGGVITAGLMAWDAYRLWGNRDYDAAIGTSIMAAGTLLGTIGATFFETSATFLGLGPVGWFTLLVVGAGFAITYYCTDQPMEVWLKNGPFGKAPAEDGVYAYLSDSPEDAYIQLLNLFVNLKVECYAIDSSPLRADKKQLLKARHYSHYIYVHSNIAQLLNMSKQDLQIHTRFREVVEQTITSGSVAQSQSDRGRYTSRGQEAAPYYVKPVKLKPIIPAEELVVAEGRLYFFRATLPLSKPVPAGADTIRYRNNIQALIQIRGGEMIFPQPPLDQVEKAEENLKAGKISLDQASFEAGQPTGFFESLFDAPKTHPENYYWADSRDQN